MDGLAEYGEEDWFRLGDRDFATHIARTARIREGRTLTEVVRSLQDALGIPTRILPMADEPVRTEVRTDEGWLDFQEYFVHRRQGPEVREVRFTGERAADRRRSSAAIEAADVIVIGPSNPIVSIGPILAGPIRAHGRRRAAARRPGRGGQPDRRRRRAQGAGRPDARRRSGHESSARGVARMYARPRRRVRPRHASMPRSSPRSRRSACGPSSPTRSWPTHAGRARLARAVLDFAGRP